MSKKLEAVIKLFHSLGRKIAAKKSGKIETPLNAEAEAATMFTILKESGLNPDDMHKFIKSESDIIKYLNQIEALNKQSLKQETLASGLGKYFKKEGEVIQFPKARIEKQRGVHRGVGAGVQASGPSATRIKQGFSTQSKLNHWSENEQWAKDFIGRKNAEFNSLNRADQKEVLDMFNAQIKKHKPKEPKAYGGRAGYDTGKLVQGESYISPKNFYGVGLGPLLEEFMSEGRPIDEEGFHTTLNKNDLMNLWNYLKENQDVDLKKDLMFRFGRVNPDKNSMFHLGLGKDKAEIGFKKQFAGGGVAGMLGEPTYVDDNHRVPLALGRGTEQAIQENKALEEKIDRQKRMTEMLNKKYEDIAIKNAPGGVLMDPPPETNWSLIEELENPKDRGLLPDNYVEYDDGTVFLKHEGKYYNQDGTQVDGPSEDAKIIPKTIGVAEGGRVPLKKGKKVLDLLSFIRSRFGPTSITTADKLTRPTKAIEAENLKLSFDRLNNKIATQEAMSKAESKIAGPITTKDKIPYDLKPESTDHTTWLLQEKFFDPKALDMFGKKVPSNWIAKEKKAAQKLIDDLGPLDVSPNHPNYKYMKATRQSAKDRLESIKITEALGGNIQMHDWLRMNRKNIKMSDYIKKPGTKKAADELSGIKKAFIQKQAQKEGDPGWIKQGEAITEENFGTSQFAPSDDVIAARAYAGKVEDLRKEFPGISDDLINKILTDDNPQRVAEVKATMREALKMQEKGMGPDEIINIFKNMKRTKQASGGLAGMLGE